MLYMELFKPDVVCLGDSINLCQSYVATYLNIDEKWKLQVC